MDGRLPADREVDRRQNPAYRPTRLPPPAAVSRKGPPTCVGGPSGRPGTGRAPAPARSDRGQPVIPVARAPVCVTWLPRLSPAWTRSVRYFAEAGACRRRLTLPLPRPLSRAVVQVA